MTLRHRWDWLASGRDPLSDLLTHAEQREGERAWAELVGQWDKLSARVTWLAENEDSPEFAEGAAATSRSRARFEQMLRDLAAWSGTAPADLAGLLLDQEEATA